LAEKVIIRMSLLCVIEPKPYAVIKDEIHIGILVLALSAPFVKPVSRNKTSPRPDPNA